MRPDMHKVIVERRRRGGVPTKGFLKRITPRGENDPFDLPRTEAMRRRHLGSPKELNENLRPLYRFLRSQAGRPWNKVYSEIREHLSPTNAVQKHVFDHVMLAVQRDVIEQVYERGRRRIFRSKAWFGSRYPELANDELYVCPRTGLLRVYRADTLRSQRRHRKPVALPLHRIDVRRFLAQRNGAWFEITFDHDIEPFPAYRPEEAAHLLYDRVFRAYKKMAFGALRAEHLGFTKRALSKKDLGTLVGNARPFAV